MATQKILQYSCPENPMDRGAWGATVHGVAKSQTRLSDFSSAKLLLLVGGMLFSKDHLAHSVFRAHPQESLGVPGSLRVCPGGSSWTDITPILTCFLSYPYFPPDPLCPGPTPWSRLVSAWINPGEAVVAWGKGAQRMAPHPLDLSCSGSSPICGQSSVVSLSL